MEVMKICHSRAIIKLENKYDPLCAIKTIDSLSVMDPRIRCIAGCKPNTEQLRAVKAFVKEAGDALLELRLYPNLDTTSADDLPSGMLAIMEPAAPVNAALISDQLFEGVAGVKVLGDVPKEKALIKQATAALQEAVQQQPEPGVRFNGEVRSAKHNRDTRQWAPELGGPGSFVGLYSQLQDDHRTKRYWIVGRSTVSAYVQDLKAALVKEQPTYRDLVNADEWKKRISFGVDGANRNLGRMLANAAEACGVVVPRRSEICAHLIDSNHLQPEMAVPDIEQHTHAIQTVGFEGKPAVALSYGVVFAEECYAERFLLVASQYDGIISFPLSDYAAISNAMALPADTGRKVAPAQLPVGAQHYAGRTTGVMWEGGDATHPDLHVDAFNSIGTPVFRDGMRQLGWNTSDREDRLVPLAVKIYH